MRFHTLLVRAILPMCLMCVSTLSSLAHRADINSITVINNLTGLPSDQVVDVVSDSKGFVWIATNEALTRYDGYNIKSYTNINTSDSLIFGKMFTVLCFAEPNTLYVGTNDGLYSLNTNNEQFKELSLAEGEQLNDKHISDLECFNNKLWIGTFSGFNIYDTTTKQMEGVALLEDLDTPYKNLNNQIKRIRSDKKGNVWIAHQHRGFFCYNTQRKELIKYPPSDNNDMRVMDFAFDNDQVYACTWKTGIFRLNENSLDGEDMLYIRCDLPFLDDCHIYTCQYNPYSQQFWIGTSDGVHIVNSLEDPTYHLHLNSDSNSNSSLSSREIYRIFTSPNEPLVWLATHDGGVNQVNLVPNSVTSNDLSAIKERFNYSSVRSIYDHGDELWLGVKSVGLVIYNKKSGKFIHSSDHPQLKAISGIVNTIGCIFHRKSHNQLWLGSRYGGVYIIQLAKDKKSIESVTPLSQYAPKGARPYREISYIFEDRDQNIWIACNAGLYVITSRNGAVVSRHVTSWNREDLIPYTMFSAITQSDDGAMWFSTTKGVYTTMFDPENPRYPTYHKVAIEDVDHEFELTSTMYRSSDGSILVAVPYRGIFRWQEGMDHFTLDERFLIIEGRINSIDEFSQDRFALGTNYGVAICDFSHNKNNIVNLTHEDGLIDNIINQNSSCLGKDGTLYFGSNSGYSTLSVDNYVINEYQAEVALTDLLVLQESILHRENRQSSRVVRDEYGEIIQVELHGGDRSFEAIFTALSMQSSAKNKYQYKLEGYDKDWQNTSSIQRKAIYSNLRRGDYTLCVRASNNSGIWSKHELMIPIRVIPSWYLSNVALTLYAFILLLAAIYIIRLLYLKIRLRNKLLLAKVERDYLEKLNNAKLQFFTNVSHELLTPLSIISYGVEDLKSGRAQSSTTFGILGANLSRLSRLVQQVLEFHKADSGNLKLKVSHGDIIAFVHNLAKANFMPLVQRKDIKLNIISNCDTLPGWFDRDKLDKILYNLLSNAIKYNIEGGVIDIEVNSLRGDRFVEIEVHNTGNVIPQERMGELFTRFYDGAYRKFSTTGLGIGLALIKELVELHSGEITVESSVQRGTRFKVTLPIECDAYDPSQVDRDNEIAVEDSLDDIQDLIVDVDSEDTIERSDKEILLVEDDADLMTMLNTIIGRKYNVICANDGEQGAEMARRHHPAIIVSDVVMPVKDGIEMCRELKADLETSHIPIILLTARIATSDKVEGLETGADAYMTKPIHSSFLLAQIESILQNRERVISIFKSPTEEPLLETLSSFSTINDKFLQKAIELVESNISNPELELKDFTDKLHISNSTLYRKIKALTGLAPNDFVRSMRLNLAYRIIKEKGKKVCVMEVAYAVGFNSPKYFTSCFKKMYGISPSELISKYSQQ